MHKSQSLFYLTTPVHVSGVTITYLQEHKTTVTTESGNRYTVLLSAVIVEELELISNSSTITAELELSSNSSTIAAELELSSNSSTIAADNSTVYRLPGAVVTVVLCS